jgi:hypothetical protein
MMHKGRRWRPNIKVKERPFAEGSSDWKFYKPSKIMVLTSFELSLPPSYASWVVKVASRIMSICLTNHKLKTSCPVKYEYPNLMLLDLGSQARSCHCKYTRIWRTANGVPPCPMIWNKPTSKWQDKQTMNTLTSLLSTIGIAFYCEMRRRISTMGML